MDDLQKAILADEIYEIVVQLEIILANMHDYDRPTIKKNVDRIVAYAEKLLENLNLSAGDSAQRATKCAERAGQYAQDASSILQEIRSKGISQVFEADVSSDEQNADAAAEAAAKAAAEGQADKAAEEADKAAKSNILLLIKLSMITNTKWKSKMPNLASRLMTHINVLIATAQPGSSASISSFTSPRPAAAPSVDSFAASSSSALSGANPSLASAKPTGFNKGDQIEARFRNGKHWFSGKIKAKHADATYDIDFADGDKEQFVSHENVRQIVDFQVGESIWVLKTNGNLRAGTIKIKNKDGTFNIEYTDGTKENNVLATNMARSVVPVSPSATSAASAVSFARPSVVTPTAASVVTAPAGLAAPQGLLPLEELIPKIEKLPDSAVKKDLRQLIQEENDPILVSKETVAVLEKLNSFGVNPYFEFAPFQGLVRITAKPGDQGLFYLQHPQEIAKLIYSLMDKAEIELVHYPRDLPVQDGAALSTLLADINSNFSILQSELDSLKPQFTKKVASAFRYDAPTKATITKLATIKRTHGANFEAHLLEIQNKMKELNDLRQKYYGNKDDPNSYNRKDARTINTLVSDIKNLLKARSRDSNATEMAAFKAAAKDYNTWKDWFHRYSYHEKAGGTRKRRARKTRRS